MILNHDDLYRIAQQQQLELRRDAAIRRQLAQGTRVQRQRADWLIQASFSLLVIAAAVIALVLTQAALMTWR
jgi:hypothetical protein